MKTLYVSDLGETLLNCNQRNTEYTNKVLNKLLKRVHVKKLFQNYSDLKRQDRYFFYKVYKLMRDVVDGFIQYLFLICRNF